MKQNIFSEDGFLIHQSSLSHILYGKYPSSQNGCGWIAVYNYLKAIHHPLSAKKIIKQMKHGLFLQGKFGTNLLFLYCYLLYLHHPVFLCPHISCTASKVSACAGILMYWTGYTFHFVAFRKTEDSSFFFYNVENKRPFFKDTMKNFLKQYSKLPFLFLISPISKPSKISMLFGISKGEGFMAYYGYQRVSTKN